LIEQHAGRFPLWLAPEQVRVIPIGDRHLDYARQIASELSQKGIRVHLDERNERLNFKIRGAQLFQVPYMLVIGDQELSDQTVSPRKVSGEQLDPISVATFCDTLVAEGALD